MGRIKRGIPHWRACSREVSPEEMCPPLKCLMWRVSPQEAIKTDVSAHCAVRGIVPFKGSLIRGSMKGGVHLLEGP